MPIPMFSNDFYGVNANPGSFSCDSTIASPGPSTQDGFGFKFLAKENVGIAGVVVYWVVASGTPSFTVGFEALNTSGTVANPAVYIGGASLAGVTPPGVVASSYIDLSSLAPDLTPGTAYALTFRQTATGTTTVSRLAVGIGLPNNGAPALITQTNGTWSVNSSRAGGFIVYENSDPITLTAEQPFSVPIQAAGTFVYTTTTAFATSGGLVTGGDEFGLKWAQTGAGYLYGIEWYGQVSSLSTSTYDVVVYKDDVAIHTQSIVPALHRAAASSGRNRIPFQLPVPLVGGSNYRLTLKPTGAGTLTIEWQQILDTAGGITSAVMRDAAFGCAYLCARADAGSWTDETNRILSITPILVGNATGGVSGGGSGMFLVCGES